MHNQAFQLGFMKSATAAGFSEAQAFTLMAKLSYDGASRHEVNQFAPVSRRQLSEAEKSEISGAQRKITPKIFKSMADPVSADMSSNGWATVLPGLLGAAGGSMLGGMASDGHRTALISAIGALLGGGLGAGVGYQHSKAKNNDLEEAMRKLPEGATRDDYQRDPRVQADLDRTSRMQAALAGAGRGGY